MVGVLPQYFPPFLADYFYHIFIFCILNCFYIFLIVCIFILLFLSFAFLTALLPISHQSFSFSSILRCFKFRSLLYVIFLFSCNFFLCCHFFNIFVSPYLEHLLIFIFLFIFYLHCICSAFFIVSLCFALNLSHRLQLLAPNRTYSFRSSFIFQLATKFALSFS